MSYICSTRANFQLHCLFSILWGLGKWCERPGPAWGSHWRGNKVLLGDLMVVKAPTELYSTRIIQKVTSILKWKVNQSRYKNFMIYICTSENYNSSLFFYVVRKQIQALVMSLNSCWNTLCVKICASKCSQPVTTFWSSSSLANRWDASLHFMFGSRWKSLGAKSGLYGAW